MSLYDTFTVVQKDTFNRLTKLERELREAIDPSIATLNKQVGAILAEIDAVQDECQHRFEDGVCVVCGRQQK